MWLESIMLEQELATMESICKQFVNELRYDISEKKFEINNLSSDILRHFSLNSAPVGLEDVSKYPELFTTLLASGMWTLEDLKKLAGLNFLRVFREVERVRITTH